MALVPSSLSDYALAELRRMEGAIPYVYDDQGGVYPPKRVTSFSAVKGYPTIGVGHRIYPSEEGRFSAFLAGGRDMSSDELDALLREDVETRVAKTLRPKVLVPITQSMWDALVLQAFNTGPNTNALARTIAAINAGDMEGAAAELGTGATTSKGKTLEGLVRRREAEVALFLKGVREEVSELATQPWVWAVVGSVSLLSLIGLAKLWQIKRRRVRAGTAERTLRT